MKTKHIILTAAFCLFAVITANAQFNETNNLFYHSFRTPQSNQLNPSFFPANNTVYISLPAAGVHFGSPLAIKDVAHLDTNETTGEVITAIDINSMLDALNENNNFRMGTEINILGFGFKFKNMFFNFNSKMHNDINIGLPIGTINALRYGNVNSDGTPTSEVTLVNGDLLNFTNYLEFSLGGGYKFDNMPLTVGAHAKLLVGMANLQTDNTRAIVHTSDDFESLSVDLYYQVQSAAALAVDTNTNKTSFSLGNMGVAFDLGAHYEIGPVSISASILDISPGIHWRKNVVNITPEGGHTVIVYDGQDVSSVVSGGNMSIDSLASYYQTIVNGLAPMHDTNYTYWFGIPTKINLGVNYSFAKFFRAGLLFHGQFDRGVFTKQNFYYGVDLTDRIVNTFRYNTTLTLGVNLFNWVELLLGSSVVYDGQKMDFFNPGIGLVLTPGTVVQFHLMADYVSSIRLVESKAFNVRMGLSLLFGKGNKKSITQD